MRVLFDTSHILPFFRIETSIPEHAKGLKRVLSETDLVKEIVVSDLTLLEVRWLLLRLKKKEKEEKEK